MENIFKIIFTILLALFAIVGVIAGVYHIVQSVGSLM